MKGDSPAAEPRGLETLDPIPARRLLVVDNYDSFTYNLVQYLGELGADVHVRRNDVFSIQEVMRLAPDRVVISPGPGRPRQAGICLDLTTSLAGKIPILGVCLGHQVIGEAFGGTIVAAPQLRHGKVSRIHHRGDSLFEGIESPFEATRYHSLVVRESDLPGCLQITAWTEDGLIMGLRHREHEIYGLQFHPESILTGPGKSLLGRFLC